MIMKKYLFFTAMLLVCIIDAKAQSPVADKPKEKKYSKIITLAITVLKAEIIGSFLDSAQTLNQAYQILPMQTWN